MEKGRTKAPRRPVAAPGPSHGKLVRRPGAASGRRLRRPGWPPRRRMLVAASCVLSLLPPPPSRALACAVLTRASRPAGACFPRIFLVRARTQAAPLPRQLRLAARAARRRPKSPKVTQSHPKSPPLRAARSAPPHGTRGAVPPTSAVQRTRRAPARLACGAAFTAHPGRARTEAAPVPRRRACAYGGEGGGRRARELTFVGGFSRLSHLFKNSKNDQKKGLCNVLGYGGPKNWLSFPHREFRIFSNPGLERSYSLNESLV